MDRKQCRDCHIIYVYWDHSVCWCLKPTKLLLLESLLTEVCIMSVIAWTYFFQGWWEPHGTALFWDCSISSTRKSNWSRGHLLDMYVFCVYMMSQPIMKPLMSYDLLAGGHGIQGDQKKKIPNFHCSKHHNWWTLDNDFSYWMKAMILQSMKKRRWCSGIMQDSHSCDPGSIPGRRRSRIWRELFTVIIILRQSENWARFDWSNHDWNIAK